MEISARTKINDLLTDHPFLLLGIFLGVTGLAMASGHWRNGISAAEYRYRFSRLDHPTYQHARGHVPAYTAND